MIDELGGMTRERMRDIFYNVYNKNLGRREVLTFVADGISMKVIPIYSTDLRAGRYGVDKGMTK